MYLEGTLTNTYDWEEDGTIEYEISACDEYGDYGANCYYLYDMLLKITSSDSSSECDPDYDNYIKITRVEKNEDDGKYYHYGYDGGNSGNEFITTYEVGPMILDTLYPVGSIIIVCGSGNIVHKVKSIMLNGTGIRGIGIDAQASNGDPLDDIITSKILGVDDDNILNIEFDLSNMSDNVSKLYCMLNYDILEYLVDPKVISGSNTITNYWIEDISTVILEGFNNNSSLVLALNSETPNEARIRIRAK